jgi:hypothetical protein
MKLNPNNRFGMESPSEIENKYYKMCTSRQHSEANTSHIFILVA